MSKSLNDVLDIMTQPRLEWVFSAAKISYGAGQASGVKVAIMAALHKLQSRERIILDEFVSQPGVVDRLAEEFSKRPSSGMGERPGKVGDSAKVDKS